MGRKSNAAKLGVHEEGVAVRCRKGVWTGIATDRHGKDEWKVGFATSEDALAYARKRRAEFIAGASASEAYLDVLFEDYKKNADASPKWKGRVKTLVDALVRDGIRNVKAPDFRKRYIEWIRGMTTRSIDPHSCKEDRPLSWSTRNQAAGMIATVISVAKAADEDGSLGIVVNPADNIVIPDRPDSKLKPTFTVAELRKLVGREFEHDKWWLLNCALVYTGLRSSMAAWLKLDWFDFDGNSLRFTNTKNGTQGSQFLQPEFKEIVLGEIARRGMTPETAKGWLIEDERIRRDGEVNPRGPYKEAEDRTSDDSHSYAFQQMLGRLGIDPVIEDGRKRTTHSLRHTFIALHQARGVDIAMLQRWVGHKSRSMTTQTYGSEAGLFESPVASWPEKVMCLRHAPDSAFHKPAPKATAQDATMVAMMAQMAALQAQIAKLAGKVADAELFVVDDDAPLQGPGSIGA